MEDGVFDGREARLRRAGAGGRRRRNGRMPKLPLPRPNSTFVTHLIATAEQVPQTRSLRRATPADAQTAYGARRSSGPGAGIRTRQII